MKVIGLFGERQFIALGNINCADCLEPFREGSEWFAAYSHTEPRGRFVVKVWKKVCADCIGWYPEDERKDL